MKELHNMDFGLSVLDISPVSSGSNGARALRNTLELSRLADQLGYERYWLAEHHNLPSIASSAPEIMIGHVANITERIRGGAGGIMLPNHAPLKVAETFRVLRVTASSVEGFVKSARCRWRQPDPRRLGWSRRGRGSHRPRRAVEYGKSIPQVTEAVRRNVIDRVENLVSFRVTEVSIAVNDVLLPEELI
jgi:hypothetical protein